jgi:hypothetical protein
VVCVRRLEALPAHARSLVAHLTLGEGSAAAPPASAAPGSRPRP